MKLGLGLYRKYRNAIAYSRYLCFCFKKYFIGFDVANQYLQRVDKRSLQLILIKNGAKLGSNCDIETGIVFHNCKGSYSNLIGGNNCHIGKNCFFDLKDKVIIKNNVVISMQCTFITHLDLGKSMLASTFPTDSQPTHIDEHCYIGARSTILMGVTIGSFSFIAASSLINKSIESNGLYGGVPAKLIRKLE